MSKLRKRDERHSDLSSISISKYAKSPLLANRGSLPSDSLSSNLAGKPVLGRLAAGIHTEPDEFSDYQMQHIAQLKIETRLKQLTELTNSKDHKWDKTFNSSFPKNDDYDFFAYLDEKLKF